MELDRILAAMSVNGATLDGADAEIALSNGFDVNDFKDYDTASSLGDSPLVESTSCCEINASNSNEVLPLGGSPKKSIHRIADSDDCSTITLIQITDKDAICPTTINTDKV